MTLVRFLANIWDENYLYGSGVHFPDCLAVFFQFVNQKKLY